MYNIIINIIAWIAIIWLSVVVLANILIYLYSVHNPDSKLVCITRDTYLYTNEYEEWYIIPTISFYFSFKNGTYPTFTLTWLKWKFYITYHIKDEEEENIETQIIYEKRNKKDKTTETETDETK